MTLEELYEIEAALEFTKYVDSYLDEAEEALRIIKREIKLKTMIPNLSEETEKGRSKDWRDHQFCNDTNCKICFNYD